MIIGFSEERMTVSEGDGGFYVDIFPIMLNFTILRLSELEYISVIQHLESKGSAIVVSIVDNMNTVFDAILGEFFDGLLMLRYSVQAGNSEFFHRSHELFIHNDFLIEDEECLVLSISSFNDLGENALCSDGENYFCEQTICIEDNDGNKCLTVRWFCYYYLISYRATSC